jgi:hypothetical protein
MRLPIHRLPLQLQSFKHRVSDAAFQSWRQLQRLHQPLVGDVSNIPHAWGVCTGRGTQQVELFVDLLPATATSAFKVLVETLQMLPVPKGSVTVTLLKGLQRREEAINGRCMNHAC